jgi:hypothetical protein
MFGGPRVRIMGGGVGGMIVGHILTRALRKLGNSQRQNINGYGAGRFGAWRR